MKTGRIFWNQSMKRIRETNLLKTLRICDPQYETYPDSSITKRNESFWSQDSWIRYETNPWIRKTNPHFYESVIWFPHPYLKPLIVNIYWLNIKLSHWKVFWFKILIELTDRLHYLWSYKATPIVVTITKTLGFLLQKFKGFFCSPT